MKYIKEATENLKVKGPCKNGEPSLLEKVILSQKDEKIATIMALDLILVGIDTVSFKFMAYFINFKNNFVIFLRFQWLFVLCFINWPLDRRNNKKYTKK